MPLTSGNEVGFVVVKTSPMTGFVSGLFAFPASSADAREVEAIMRSQVPESFGRITVEFDSGAGTASLSWRMTEPATRPN